MNIARNGILALIVALALASVLPSGTAAESAAGGRPATAGEPEKPLGPLAHLVGGEWRGQIKLLDGRTIHARHIFEWSLGQTIIKSKTYGAVGEAAERLVYEGVYSWHPEKKRIVFREFSAAGSMNEGTVEPAGETLKYTWTEYSPGGGVEYRETLSFPDKDHYVSRAEKKTETGWEAATGENRFARQPAEAAAWRRELHKEVTVAAPLAEVWNAWTTAAGVKTFFGPDARVEARVGGPYEIYFSTTAPEGLRGSEGCKIHTVEPMKLLVFEWNAPPSIPALRNSGVHTLVYLQLEELGPKQTRVTLTHTGWGEGEDWDKAYAYFDRAWDAVLSNLHYRFAVGPVAWPGHFIRAGESPAEKQADNKPEEKNR